MKDSFDVIILCVTGLNDNLFDPELFEDRYVTYRCDRNSDLTRLSRNGGCLISVKRNPFSKRMINFELDKEDVWVSVKHVNGYKAFFNVRYVELDRKFLDYKKHFDRISEIFMSSNPNDTFVLTVDYNMGDSVMWSCKSERLTELVRHSM